MVTFTLLINFVTIKLLVAYKIVMKIELYKIEGNFFLKGHLNFKV